MAQLTNPGFDSNLGRLIEKMSKLPDEKYMAWQMVTENGTSINIDFHKPTAEVIVTFKSRDEHREKHLYMSGGDAFRFRRIWDATVEESRLGPKDEDRNRLLSLARKAEDSDLRNAVLNYFGGDKG